MSSAYTDAMASCICLGAFPTAKAGLVRHSILHRTSVYLLMLTPAYDTGAWQHG